jgi:hypothetical protein
MSILRLEIRQDGSAFGDEPGVETAAILRKLADKVQHGATEGVLYDANGANVGGYETEEID